MGRDTPRSYGTPQRANRSGHDSAWDNPRDSDRDPEPYDPTMDRRTIGTNVPEQRNGR